MRVVPLVASTLLSATPVLAQERLALTLDLDPVAAAKLAGMGERVTVSAWYYGEPAHSSVPVNEMGLVTLGTEELEVDPTSQVVELGDGLARAPLAQVTTPMVNVNVYTSRRAAPDNLLDCGIVDDAIAAVAAAGASGTVIACTLLNP